MSGMDDLFKSLAMFNEGMTQLSTSLAANDANKQLNELNARALDDGDRLKAQAEIGQNLALRLQASGADASQISAVANRLSPSAGEQYQTLAAKDQQASSQQFTHDEGRLHAQDAERLQALRNEALLGKGAAAQKKMLMGLGDKFSKREDVKPVLTNLPKIDDALKMIQDTKGQMGATAMINLAQLGLIRGAAGRVNEKEIEGANESPSKRASLWKRMGLEATGEVPMNIQTFWEKVLQRANNNARQWVKDKAKGYAQEASELSDGDIDPVKLERAILKGHNLYDEDPDTKAPAAPKAQAAPNPNQPNPYSKYITTPGQ